MGKEQPQDLGRDIFCGDQHRQMIIILKTKTHHLRGRFFTYSLGSLETSTICAALSSSLDLSSGSLEGLPKSLESAKEVVLIAGPASASRGIADV